MGRHDEQLRRLDALEAPDLWPTVTARASQGATPEDEPHARRKAPALAFAAVLAVGAVAAGAILRVDDRPRGQNVRTDTTIAPAGLPELRSLATVDVGTRSAAVDVGEGAVWVSGDASVLRIDPVSGRILATIPVGFFVNDIAVGAGAVWATGGGDGASPQGSLVRIDPNGNGVSERIRLDGGYAIAVASGAVWVANARDRVERIDPATLRVVATVPVAVPVGIAGSGGAVWVTSTEANALVRIDPATNRVVATVPVGRQPNAVATSGTSVWVASFLDRTLTRIDAQTTTVVGSVRIDGGPSGLAGAADGGVWVASQPPAGGGPGNTISFVTTSGQVSAPLAVGVVRGIAGDGSSVWITDQTAGTAVKVG
jgi:YVTN family beta-propeller protein